MKRLGFVCGSYLSVKANSNDDIWVIDGDLADSDGAEEFIIGHKERFIAAGIAEQNMVSMASGLASVNKRPWVFSFAAFLCYRAYDQIRVCISQTKLPVVLVGTHSGGCSGRNGKTHIALNDIAVISSLPNIDIWAPADEADTKLAIDFISNSNRPSYLRLPRDPQEDIPVSTDYIRWIGEPTIIAIVSYGASTQWAIKTRNILLEQGIKIGILHFCKIHPLKSYEVLSKLSNVKVAFVLEDHYSIGGFASLLTNFKFDIKYYNICWPSSWCGQSGQTEALLEHFSLSPAQIAKKIEVYLRDEYKENE